MGIEDTPADGATPLDPDEARGLIPSHITTQGQLNAWEHQNILEGMQWAASVRRKDLLTTEFMRRLHKRLFGRTWAWAGTLRLTERNIGVAPEHIAVRLNDLCEDVRTQLQYRSYPLDAIAARFHHRLVYVHPFANGNGRFSRVMTDLLLVEQGAEPFTWGAGDLVDQGGTRNRYLEALRAADEGNYQLLLAFVRSSS